MKARIRSYIEQFSQIFEGNPWLDESYSKKLNNLSDEQVFTQSPYHNHSVAEVVSHIIVWRKEIIRRLTHNSSQRLLTGESDDNWKGLAQLQQIGWQQLYADLKHSQQQLIDLLENIDDSFLDEQLGETEFNKEYFVAGLLHHDLYHLGQVGLIVKMGKLA